MTFGSDGSGSDLGASFGARLHVDNVEAEGLGGLGTFETGSDGGSEAFGLDVEECVARLVSPPSLYLRSPQSSAEV